MTASRELAIAGPLLGDLGDVDWSEWDEAVLALEATLPESPERPRRIEQLYVPVYLWLLAQVRRGSRRPIVVGVSAPQGAGKSTLVSELAPLLRARGLRVVGVSIDDFYLTREQQLRRAAEHPGNRVLEHRGAPGTHDVALGTATLERLRALGEGDELWIPAYDKSAHGGRGDRLPRELWPTVRGPIDLVLVDGWCLAFRPVGDGQLTDPSLGPVDRYLEAYASWRGQLDALIDVRARELSQIVAWRVEAEERASAAGRPGLGHEAIVDYISRFLPVYETYAATAGTTPPPSARQLRILLDLARLPVRP